MRKFVVDTSSLIDLEIYYPYIVFPSLWNFLFKMFDEGKLFSVKEVYRELKDSQEVWKDYRIVLEIYQMKNMDMYLRLCL